IDCQRPAEVAEAEAIRKSHRRAEATVRNIAELHMLGAFFVLLALVALAATGKKGDGRSWTGPPISAPVPLAALADRVCAVGWGLRRYRSWARWATLAASTVILALAAALILLLCYAWPSGYLIRTATAGVLIALSVSPVAYAAIVLMSRKASFVFSEPY